MYEKEQLLDRIATSLQADAGDDSPFADGGGPSRRFFGMHERNLIIHLSAHAAVDGKGNPCLLLYDADPFDSSTWLPIADVLDHLKEVDGVCL